MSFDSEEAFKAAYAEACRLVEDGDGCPLMSFLGPQLGALSHQLVWGRVPSSPTKIDYRKKLVPLFQPLYWRGPGFVVVLE